MFRIAAWMLLVVVSILACSLGCQKPAPAPVAEAPVQEPILEPFPEEQVPAPEPQPQPMAQTPPAPVDTAAKASPSPAPAPQPKESYATPERTKIQRTYVVRKGDTLQKISKKYYGTTKQWRRIYQANRSTLAKGPDKIQIGMKLIIP